jgi:pantothenate kinase
MRAPFIVSPPVDALVERARSLEQPGRRALLGIAGPPGAGKSTLAAELAGRLGASAGMIGMDGFHLSQPFLAQAGRLDRKGAIDTFDAEGFVSLVRRLRHAPEEVIYAPEFRRDREESIAAAVVIEPRAELVIVEGNYLLVDRDPWSELDDLFDEIWYCDCQEQVRIQRLIARHRDAERSEQEARKWALGSDQKNARLVEATRSRADLVIRLDSEVDVANPTATG